MVEGEVLEFEEIIGNWLDQHEVPIPRSMIPVCIEAIRLANEGNWYTEVTLPEGIYWHVEKHEFKRDETAPAYAIVWWCHLDKWIKDG